MPQSLPPTISWPRLLFSLFSLLLFFCQATTQAQADWSYYAQRAFGNYASGEYADTEQYCERIMGFGIDDPNLVRISIDSKLAQGKYEEAAKAARKATKQFAGHFPILVQAVHALRQAGQAEEASDVLKELDRHAKQANPKTLSAGELSALG